MGVTKMNQAKTALNEIVRERERERKENECFLTYSFKLGDMRETDRIGLVIFDDIIEQHPLATATLTQVQKCKKHMIDANE
jgi:hypothetical protein